MSYKEPRRDVETWRKVIFYVGTFLIVIGFIFFFSTFVRIAGSFRSFNSGENPMRNSIIGFIMIFIGNIFRSIGKGGLAGSGVLLSPEKQREDLEPFSRSKGGMFSDAYDEFKGESKYKKDRENDSEIKIMVRCKECSVLNDEDAKFCDNCGKPL